jgi:hypothetical protein
MPAVIPKLLLFALLGLTVLPFFLNALPGFFLWTYGILFALYIFLTANQKEQITIAAGAGALAAPVIFREYFQTYIELPPTVFVFFVAFLWTALFTFVLLWTLPEKEKRP